MLILDQLQQTTDFTATEKRIAAYILAHLPAVTTIYIKDLATATYTSHSAIIRLAQKLGYHGYRDFQHALSAAAVTQAHTVQAVDVNFPVAPDDDEQTIAKKMADLTVTTVQKSFAQLDVPALRALAAQLTQAQRIFIFAQGDSQMRARSFQNKLIKINKFAIIADEYADDAWNAANVGPKDCAFFISYNGTTHVHQQYAQYFHDQHLPSLLLTGNPNSPLIPLVQHDLVSVQAETSFAKIGTFASQAAFEYLLDSLFAVMYAQDLKHHLTDLQHKQQLIQGGPLENK
ncbi:MurR/RpiR family transcriptional regulator [Lactiplantibacillus daowaiensis]|uniref:MurR/RpiR family transcriptional regulator n=1 Tax=Lactiplantibacillus daowaiensis TaxID=2559918 RepID=A0ABW1S2Z1_9LACO|nr:MurR/RpiR family transcriptional regulator [Lactiplantibacillus daowaiensis]